MKRAAPLFSCILTLVTLQLHAAEADLNKGERLYRQNCALCHGKQGEKRAMEQSPPIQGVEKNEILTALQLRKAGKIMGAGNTAKARLSEQDMEDIAAYAESLVQ